MHGIAKPDETFFTQSCEGSRHIIHRKSKKLGNSLKKFKSERVPVLIVRDWNGTIAGFVYENLSKDKMHD